MAKRRYGSKANYEAERGAIRDQRREWERRWNMSDAERDAEDRKEAAKDMLDHPERGFTIFAMFMGAAMAGGKSATEAGKQADSAISTLRGRFT